MLFPENPEKCPTLWDAIAKQLRQEAMCFVITEGYGNPRAEAQRPTDDLAQQVITRLQQSQLCRISASRGAAVSPHYAGMRDGASVFITDFLSSSYLGVQVIQPEQIAARLESCCREAVACRKWGAWIQSSGVMSSTQKIPVV